MSSATLNTCFQPGLRQWPAMVKRLTPIAHSDLLKGFGPRLRAARQALNYRQAEFARALGVTPQRLANWESDTNPPETYILVKIKHLGISVDYLLTGDMGNLSAKLMQGLINHGVTPGADIVAYEVRDAVKEQQAPLASPRRHLLHEEQSPRPRRFIHPRDVQSE
jgi:transcriptional regulator with XRE-family HTH domain